MMEDLNNLLVTELRRLEAESASLRETINQAKDRLSKVDWRLDHIRALLDPNGPSDSDLIIPLPRSSNINNTHKTVCDIAEEVLDERAGEPMYYKALTEEVIKRGGILRGATPWANLTARMVQDQRFVRPTAKGFYALRKDYPNARNVGARTRGGSRRQPK